MLIEGFRPKHCLNSPGLSAETCRDIFSTRPEEDREKEHFFSLGLTIQREVIYVDLVSIGTLNASLVHAREAFRTAIAKAAHSMLVFHTHPSGSVSPSSQDITVTARLKAAGEVLGIELVDHIILNSRDTSGKLTSNKFYSFKESCWENLPATYEKEVAICAGHPSSNLAAPTSSRAAEEPSTVSNVVTFPGQSVGFLPDRELISSRRKGRSGRIKLNTGEYCIKAVGPWNVDAYIPGGGYVIYNPNLPVKHLDYVAFRGPEGQNVARFYDGGEGKWLLSRLSSKYPTKGGDADKSSPDIELTSTSQIRVLGKITEVWRGHVPGAPYDEYL